MKMIKTEFKYWQDYQCGSSDCKLTVYVDKTNSEFRFMNISTEAIGASQFQLCARVNTDVSA